MEASLALKPEEVPADSEEYRFGKPPKDLPPLDPPAPTRITDTASVKLEVLHLEDKKDRARFIDMVIPIYEGDPNYIVPLRMERMKFLDPRHNPTFKNLDVRPIVALQGDRVVGRMTAHIDRAYDAYHQCKVGWFGFFECINDRRIAHAMLADATSWLKSNGCTEVVGPMNFTTNHQAGLLVENFSRPPFVEMTYNLQYYEELLTSFGFAKAKDLYAWTIDLGRGLDNPKVARIARIAEKIKKREGVSIRPVNMKDLKAEIERLFTLYNAAWEKNWGFVQIGREEFESVVDDLRRFIVPDTVLFVELHGKPVGFTCTLPNVNDIMPKNGRLFPFGWYKLLTGLKTIKRGRLFTLGVVPEFRKRGLESLMFVETVVRAKNLGWTGGEIGWTLEDNDLINRAIEAMDGKLDRRYRLLGMSLV